MEKRSAESLEKKKQYNAEYTKQNYHRIPLNVTNAKYEEIKCASEKANEPVNTYIKKAIDARLYGKN